MKEQSKRIYVSGTFDMLHPGHIELFRRAKEKGTVIVGLNTDEFTARYKRRPVMTLGERRAMVLGCRYVDEVVINWAGEDSKPAILEARADYIMHGDDWTGDSLMKQMGLTREWLGQHKIGMLYVPYTKGVSSSEILSRCQK